MVNGKIVQDGYVWSRWLLRLHKSVVFLQKLLGKYIRMWRFEVLSHLAGLDMLFSVLAIQNTSIDMNGLSFCCRSLRFVTRYNVWKKSRASASPFPVEIQQSQDNFCCYLNISFSSGLSSTYCLFIFGLISISDERTRTHHLLFSGLHGSICTINKLVTVAQYSPYRHSRTIWILYCSACC